MAKKKRTAKQKAATKKLVAFNKRRKQSKKRAAGVRKASSSKKTKSSSRSKRSGSTVAKRKTSRKSQAKGILGKIAKKQTVDRVLKGAGAAALAGSVLTVVSPQNANNPVIRLAAGFVADQSVEGAIGAALSNPQTINMIRGVVTQGIGSFGGGNQMMAMQGGNGFA